MREIVAACLLFLTTSAYAYRGRPVTDLRFDGGSSPWLTEAASDGSDFVVLSAGSDAGNEHVYTRKVVDGQAVGPRHQIARGKPAGLTWTGSRYLAGWTRDEALWAAPLSREGSLLATPEEPVLQADRLFLAANRTSALAFGYTQQQVTAQPLALDGTRSGNAVVHAAAARIATVTVAAAAGGFAMVFTGNDGTWLMLFRANGTAITPSPVLLDGPYGGSDTRHSNVASIATDGTDTLVVFGTGVFPQPAELKSVVVGANGAVQATHLLHSVPSGGDRALLPAGLVWDGTQYVAAVSIQKSLYDFEDDTALLRIARTGEAAGEPAVFDDRDARWATDLAWNGRDLLVSFDLDFVLVKGMQAGAPRELSRTLTSQQSLALEAGGGGYLAAWEELAGGVSEIRASRIDAAGNYLDGAGILLDTRSLAAGGGLVTIAIDGNGPQWLVVWSNGRDVRGRFISRGGVAGGPFPIATGNGFWTAVRWDGTRYLVLYADGSLFLRSVSPSGAVGAPQTLAEREQPDANDSIEYRESRVVLAGGRPIAVYARRNLACGVDPRAGCSEEIAVLARRLDVADAVPVTVAENSYVDFAAASAGAQALVLFTQMNGLHGRFLSPDGTPGTPFPVDPQGTWPAIAFDGQDFAATWRLAGTPDWDIAAARITSGGAVQNRLVVRSDDDESVLQQSAMAGNASRAPLAAFVQQHTAYASTRRAMVLFAHELDDQPAPPPAPSLLCATKNGDETFTLRWQRMQNVLGFSIELEIGDGTFRQIGVAPADATSARVALPGLEGDAVRLRAWNAGGLSEGSSIAGSVPPPAASLRSSMRACAGVPVEIGVSLSGIAPFTVQWSDGFVQSNLTSVSATRTVTVTRDTTFSIVSVADASCAVNETPESVRVTVDPQPAIQDQTRATRLSPGQTATLSVVASDATGYAWFEGEPGDTSRPVGAGTATFTVSALTRSTNYWVRATNRCGSVDSQVMNVTVQGKRRAARR